LIDLENNPDSYFTISTASQIEIRVKGSKFIGQAIACVNEEEAEKVLAGIRKKYYDATHHCFAYQIGHGKERKFRYSDSGEPSGTAGKPIFDQIEGKHLTNLAIIVTRYFGGTKLGTGGLTHAYSQTAAEAINSAGIKEQFLVENISAIVQYSDYNVIEKLIHKFKGKLISRGMIDQIPALTIQLRRSRISEFKEAAIEATSGRIRFVEHS